MSKSLGQNIRSLLSEIKAEVQSNIKMAEQIARIEKAEAANKMRFIVMSVGLGVVIVLLALSHFFN